MTALGWGMAAAIGAVAGMLIAPVVFLEPNMMFGVLLYGFAGAVLGGLTSPGGAVLGGFAVGIIENLAGTLHPLCRPRPEADHRAVGDRRGADGATRRHIRSQRREPGMTTPREEAVPFAVAARTRDAQRAAWPTPRHWALAGAVAVAIVLPLILQSFVVFQLTEVMIYGLAILGLNLLTGFNGQFSLGHGAFYGIGAYITAILMHRYGVAYFWTLPAAGGICFVVGFLFGLPALRLQGLYLALATFALAVALPQLLKFHALRRLDRRRAGHRRRSAGRARDSCRSARDQWLYYFTLAIVLVMFAGAANLVKSRTGRAIMAIRDHPIAAAAMGINLPLYKTLTFGVSALYTGVAGALGRAGGAVRRARQLQLLPVGLVSGRPDHRRHGFAAGLPVRRVVRALCAEYRRKRVARLGGRDLWHHHAAGDFRDAVGCGRVHPPRRRVFVAIAQPPTIGFNDYALLRRSPMKHMTRRTILAAAPGALAFGAPFLAARPARAAKDYGPGVTDSEIKIGNTGPYSGPASSYSAIPKSQAAYCKMINEQGGINGRKINFISYDDAYTPPKTVEMARKLVEQDQVLAIASPLGTPTNSAIWHYMNQNKVPQLFVATGATKWDDPKGHPWTIGWQPNYQSEGRIYAAYILKEKPDGKIGVLYQNDDFGKDYLKGVNDGLGDKAVDDCRQGVLRDHRPDRRLAGHRHEGGGLRCLRQYGHPQIRRPGDQQGGTRSNGSRCISSAASAIRSARR